MTGFPNTRIKIVFAISYYQDKTLEWIQPYIIKYIEKGWMNKLF